MKNSLQYFQNVALSIALTAIIAISSCSSDEEMTPDMPGVPGSTNTKAPDFSLMSLDGGTVKLSDYKDKVVVLFFFGNACPSCKAAAPKVESDIYAAFSGNADFVLLGLDQWNGNNASVQSFKNTTKVTFPLLLNASAVASSYNTTYDRLVVIDKAGTVAFKGTQVASSDISKAKSKVSEIL